VHRPRTHKDGRRERSHCADRALPLSRWKSLQIIIMRVSSTNENAVLITVSALRRLFRRTSLATNPLRVIVTEIVRDSSSPLP
jgi:hypothetical protein